MKYIALFTFGWIATALPSPALAQDNEAEKLFRGMEKKLLAAKAFEITFDYQVEKRKAKGELLVTQDNKLRLKVVGHFTEKPKAGFELISDGKQVKTKGAKFFVASNGRPGIEPGGQSEWQAPKKFHATLGGIVSRAGMWYTIFLMPYLQGSAGDIDLDDKGSRMNAYDFKLAGMEKVGTKDAKVIRFRFGDGGSGKDNADITLWIDVNTLLPLKRTFVLEGGPIHIVENYHEFRLDPKVDAKAFVLPK